KRSADTSRVFQGRVLHFRQDLPTEGFGNVGQWIWIFPRRRTPERVYPSREIENVSEPAPDSERSSTTTTKFVNAPLAKPVPLIVAFVPSTLTEEMNAEANVSPDASSM